MRRRERRSPTTTYLAGVVASPRGMSPVLTASFVVALTSAYLAVDFALSLFIVAEASPGGILPALTAALVFTLITARLAFDLAVTLFMFAEDWPFWI